MKTTSSRKDTLRGVLGYVGRYRGYLVASLALCVITAAPFPAVASFPCILPEGHDGYDPCRVLRAFSTEA